MDPDEQDVLSAQEADDESVAPVDDSTTAPAETQATSPDTTSAQAEQADRELRNRLAQQGRELAQARQRETAAAQHMQRQQQHLDQQQQQIDQMSRYLTAQQQQQQQDRQRQQEAYLNSLPFEDRLEARLKMVAAENQQLRQQIAGTQQRQPMPSVPAPQRREPTQAEREQYQRDRSAEIVQAINAEYGTDLTGQEQGINWHSPETFEATLRTYAILASSADEDDEEPVVAKKASSKDDVDARIEAAVSKAIGVGRPNGATGRGPAGIPTEADLQKIVSNVDSRMGRRQTIDDLRKARDRAAAGVAIRVKNLPPE